MHRQENGSENWDVEKCCFEPAHIENVQKKLETRIDGFFEDFCNNEPFADIFSKIDCVKCSLEELALETVKNAENDYSKKAPSYNDLFTKDLMDEASYNCNDFKKTTLRRECPIIQKTLNTNEKALENFKRKFNDADPHDLWEKINNIVNFAFDFKGEEDESKYLSISSYEDMGLEKFDSEDFSLSGVIGGGIKSLIAYMRNPQWFPSRSRNAIWALYFLTDKDPFNCKMDSEFIMVNTKILQTSQNYFYPYRLFSYYALVTYRKLKERFEALGVKLDPQYRYAYVDAFFEFIAKDRYKDEIATLRARLNEDYV